MSNTDFERLVTDNDYLNERKRSNAKTYFYVFSVLLIVFTVMSFLGQIVIDHKVALLALGIFFFMTVMTTLVCVMTLHPREIFKTAIGFFELYYFGYKVAIDDVTKRKNTSKE
jgi:hypothetical protein